MASGSFDYYPMDATSVTTVVVDEAAAAAKCAQICQARQHCCNDYKKGSNQMLSCSQACMIRARGTSYAQCIPHCARTASSGCSLEVNGHTYGMCSTCTDLNAAWPSCSFGVASSASCEAGCGIDVTAQNVWSLIAKQESGAMSAPGDLSSFASQIEGAGGRILMAWSSSAAPSNTDDYLTYEKAVTFKVPGTTTAGVRTDDNGKQCTDTDYFVPVKVECVQGSCNLPATMYTGKGFNRICYDRAYGLVAPSTNPQCDWTMDGQAFRSLYMGDSGCHGMKDEGDTSVTDSGMLAIGIWTYKQCSKTLTTESAGVTGALSAGLGQFSSEWSSDATIILEWGTDSYISFKSATNPFIDRPTTAGCLTGSDTGCKSDNTLIDLTDVTTSDANLNSWILAGGGAWLCLGIHNAWDTAWAIIDKANDKWGIGCNSGNWNGRGAYYADDHYGGGWVGVKDNNEAKGGTGPTVGLKLRVEKCGETTATQATTCGDGYAPADFVGYWDSGGTRVITQTPTTVAQCAAKCNEASGCIAFQLYCSGCEVGQDCWIYTTLGNQVEGSAHIPCLKA